MRINYKVLLNIRIDKTKCLMAHESLLNFNIFSNRSPPRKLGPKRSMFSEKIKEPTPPSQTRIK